nr:unnamed protein product [Digitaria exilis]
MPPELLRTGSKRPPRRRRAYARRRQDPAPETPSGVGEAAFSRRTAAPHVSPVSSSRRGGPAALGAPLTGLAVAAELKLSLTLALGKELAGWSLSSTHTSQRAWAVSANGLSTKCLSLKAGPM